MKNRQFQENIDLSIQLNWIIWSRIFFSIVLIVSSFITSSGNGFLFFQRPFLSVSKIAVCILILSIIYLIWLNKYKNHVLLAYLQTIADSFIVTCIIFITGSYDSIFTFLYLVVIIYTAMLLLQKGSLLIATLSSIQYGILIELEYYQIISPSHGQILLSTTVEESHILYRIVILILACFAVAILSGILASQLKGAKQDLEIAQEHLKRVEKMAAMDEMISGIAHEIKNPLASLSGSIQLLHEDTQSGSYEDKLMHIILRETDRLKTIVNDIRLFSKPSTDNAEDLTISDIIEETVELFLKDPEWNQKIEIKMKLDTKAKIFIDRDHLNQILWNLLNNAAQSIENNGLIKIELKLLNKNRVYLIVEDTGVGIDKKDYNHIFDPFYTTKPEGTGLGLSIIHRIIDTYNGMIDFESTPCKGSIFTILFNTVSSNET